MSVSEDLSSLFKFNSDALGSANSDNGDCDINDLGIRVTELLNIQSAKKLTCFINRSLDDINNGNESKEDDCKDSQETELVKFTSDKCLAKSATFPCADKCKTILSARISLGEMGSKNDLTAEHEMLSGDGHSSNSLCSRSISLPTPLKLVSAMKGSREKLGDPPRKLTVKWAPDVYDPLPTAVSHVPNNRPQRHKSDKKNGKNKQKGGKTSRGNKGKDRKQSRKYAGSSNRCFKSLDNEDRVSSSSEPQAIAVDFDVGSRDPFCGHSFLKKSVTQLHFPVAEAT